MSSPPADDDEEEATDVQTEEEEWGDEALPGARVSAAADEDHSGETRTTCCVCMEPSTCSGAHRLCCIPCGHVYGRSCLENWLIACGNTSAKCGKAFERKHIINLYIPGNLWDGCCRIQEVEAHYSRVAKYLAELAPLARRHASEAKSEAQFVSEVADKLEVLAQSVGAKSEAQFVSEVADKLEVLAPSVGAEDQAVDKKLVQDVLATVMTSYSSVKGQVEMARRHYEDLIEFIVQSFDGLL
ncbi:hypothetical protein PVAP13_9KG557500 [Panicum virgatum]|uniref:RING-type domain-containing protein n=1 Tax=Panicum virgatum TaxID=38727 RepID=A0A8T0P3T6_PANVG|nr:hypothetical protein PVAP13_9KG557500 [Panicum virgatum]